jgi:hypothetical protein
MIRFVSTACGRLAGSGCTDDVLMHALGRQAGFLPVWADGRGAQMKACRTSSRLALCGVESRLYRFIADRCTVVRHIRKFTVLAPEHVLVRFRVRGDNCSLKRHSLCATRAFRFRLHPGSYSSLLFLPGCATEKVMRFFCGIV